MRNFDIKQIQIILTVNIILEIGVYLDNYGGVTDYHYLKPNTVGYRHIVKMKLLEK